MSVSRACSTCISNPSCVAHASDSSADVHPSVCHHASRVFTQNASPQSGPHSHPSTPFHVQTAHGFEPQQLVNLCAQHSQSIWNTLIQQRLDLLTNVPEHLTHWSLHNLQTHLHAATLDAFIQQHWHPARYAHLHILHTYLQYQLHAQSAKHPLYLPSAHTESNSQTSTDPTSDVLGFCTLYLGYVRSQITILQTLIDHTLQIILPIAQRRTNITRIHPGTILYKAQLYVLSERVLRSICGSTCYDQANTKKTPTNTSALTNPNVLSMRQMQLLSQQNPKSIAHHLSVYLQGQQYHWVELLDPSALVFEGIALSHCSASYSKALLSRNVRFFSLRSDKGTPLITLEVVDGKVGQVRTKAQRLVHMRYLDALNAFLQKPLDFKYLDALDCQDLLDAGFFFDPKKHTLIPLAQWDTSHVFSHDLLLSRSFCSSIPEGFICSGSLGISATYTHPLPNSAHIHHLFVDHARVLPSAFKAHILTVQTEQPFELPIDQARAFDLTGAPHTVLYVPAHSTAPAYVCAAAKECQLPDNTQLVPLDTDTLSPAPWRHTIGV